MSKFDQKNQKVNTQLNADKISIGIKPITCPNCQHGNPAKAKFCAECGTSLTFKCPICESETPLGAKFCSGCGKAISKIQEDIAKAQKIRGGENREISYTFYTRQGNRIWRINGKLWMMLFPFVLYRKPEEAVTTPEFPN